MLKERFADEVADRSRLMDNQAQALLTVELAIPSLYATVLKMVNVGEKGGSILSVGTANANSR